MSAHQLPYHLHQDNLATCCMPHAYDSLQLEQWGPDLQQINRRARLYVCALPPDQLNPAGYYDGSQTTMLSVRSCVKRKHGGAVVPIAMPAMNVNWPCTRSHGTQSTARRTFCHDSEPLCALHLQRRAKNGGRLRSGDARAGTLPLELPPPGT
jgi:hypothetical protein